MNRLAAIISLGALALTLTGCSSGASYETPSQLRTAYVDAGGECADPSDVPGDMIGEGAHALLCAEDVTMLVVFDTPEQARGYVADVVDGETIKAAVVGDRWVVTTDSADQYAGPLGGRVVTG